MFAELFRDLADGAIWITGKRLKLLAAMLDADRARLAETSGQELPSAFGRFFVTNGGSAAKPGTRPFQLIDASAEGIKKIRVVYGTVNNTAPDGMSLGDNPPYVLTVGDSGLAYIALAISWDNADINVDSVTIGLADTLPEDVFPDDEDDASGSGVFYRQVGNWSTDEDGSFHLAQDVTSSLWFEFCGFLTPLWGPA